MHCYYGLQDADVLTSKLAEVIPLEDDDLVSRYCQLIFDICTKQQVSFRNYLNVYKLLEAIPLKFSAFGLCSNIVFSTAPVHKCQPCEIPLVMKANLLKKKERM